MKISQSASLLAIAILAATTAHAEPELNGKWKATFATESDDGREADVVIDGLSGNWTTLARPGKDKKSPCVGRSMPITLADSGSSAVSLSIEETKAVPGCKDRKAKLTIVNEKTLEGEFSNGRAIKMVRQ